MMAEENNLQSIVLIVTELYSHIFIGNFPNDGYYRIFHETLGGEQSALDFEGWQKWHNALVEQVLSIP